MILLDQTRYVKLKASGRLPSPKGLALAIIRLLQQDDYKNDELLRLIQSDPAIAGELLKFSNAASFGHSRPNASLNQVIATLGALRIRVIVIAFSVLHDHRVGNCPQFDYEKFWSRALATAIAAQALAYYAKINTEENFTAGLLCSLGELALASLFPETYGEVISSTANNLQNRIEAERKAFGNDHRELNASLLLDWGLPLELVSAIYHCEAPEGGDFQEGTRLHRLTLSLNVSLTLANLCVAEKADRSAMLPDLYTKAARIGISEEQMNLLADDIIIDWQEWGKFLKIRTSEIDSIADLSVFPSKDESITLEELRKSLEDFERGKRAPMAASTQVIEGLIKMENDPERKASLIAILNSRKNPSQDS